MSRTVDVTLRGRDETGPAFRSATGNTNKLQTSASNLLVTLSGLPGPIGRLGSALSQFAVGGGITVAILGGIALVAQAFKKMEENAVAFTNRLRGIGDQTREALVARIGILQGREANLAAGRDANGADPNKAYSGADASALGSARRNKELEETRKLLNELGAELKDIDRTASSAATEKAKAAAGKKAEEAVQAAKKIKEKFDKEIAPMMGGASTRAGILSSGIGLIGEGNPRLTGPGGAPGLPVSGSVNVASEMEDQILRLSKDVIPGMADAWADAIQGMIQGTMTVGQAIKRVFIGSIGSVLVADGRANLLQAAAMLTKGIAKGNPIEWALAGKLAGIGSAEIALGSAMSGGGAGSSSLGGGGFSQQSTELGENKGEGTIIVKGGILDTGDSRQMDALAAALSELSGRRVTIVGA